MVRLDTEQERALFFDFFPLDLGVIEGSPVRLSLYTVPRQSALLRPLPRLRHSCCGGYAIAGSHGAARREGAHDYVGGDRHVIRITIDGRACVACTLLSDECPTGVVALPGGRSAPVVAKWGNASAAWHVPSFAPPTPSPTMASPCSRPSTTTPMRCAGASARPFPEHPHRPEGVGPCPGGYGGPSCIGGLGF